MIVDLMRHDLSYFCLPESIEVSSFVPYTLLLMFTTLFQQ